MTTRRPIAVSEWSESKDPVIPLKRSSRSLWPPGVIGLAGTLLLHGFALHMAILGDRAHRIPPPETRDPGSSQLKTTPAESLVFIDIPNPTNADKGDASLAWLRAAIAANPIAVNVKESSHSLNINVPGLAENTKSESPVDSGDGAEHARLLGIYSGQIQARVERIWSRPRTPVNEGSNLASRGAVEYFHCSAQIVQDSVGNVQEILLPDCNGSIAWQHSLVVAIQQASPLPAPPSPTVFNRVVTMSFVGYPYVLGGSDVGYETSTVETAQVTSRAKTPEEISREFSSFRSIGQEHTQ